MGRVMNPACSLDPEGSGGDTRSPEGVQGAESAARVDLWEKSRSEPSAAQPGAILRAGTGQPLEQLRHRPLVALESEVKRDRNRVRVHLRRIVADQCPRNDQGAERVIAERPLYVKR